MGVNSGSLEKALLEKYGGVTAEGIVESALNKVQICATVAGTSSVRVLVMDWMATGAPPPMRTCPI